MPDFTVPPEEVFYVPDTVQDHVLQPRADQVLERRDDNLLIERPPGTTP